MDSTDQIVTAADVEEGNEIFNGRGYLIVEDVRPEGGKIRLEASGYVWHLDPSRSVQVAK